MSEREVLIHIGAPKTGSTAIQRFLTDATAVLGQRGIHYPDVGLRGFGHHDLAFLMGGGYPAWATPQTRGLGELVADLQKALRGPEPCVVISSENFYLQPAPQLLREAIDGAESGRRLRVLVYLRRQDHLALSWYNQAVKAQGFAGDFESCLADTAHLWDFEAQVEPWAKAFGADSLELSIYEPDSLIGGEVVSDLVHRLGTSREGLPKPAAPINTRLCRELLEFQRQVNRLPLTVQDKRRFHREWIELTAATRDSDLFDDTPVIGPSQRRAILERHAEGNQALARRYFGRDELFLEPPPAGPEPTPWTGPDPVATQMAVGWLLTRR